MLQKDQLRPSRHGQPIASWDTSSRMSDSIWMKTLGKGPHPLDHLYSVIKTPRCVVDRPFDLSSCSHYYWTYHQSMQSWKTFMWLTSCPKIETDHHSWHSSWHFSCWLRSWSGVQTCSSVSLGHLSSPLWRIGRGLLRRGKCAEGGSSWLQRTFACQTSCLWWAKVYQYSRRWWTHPFQISFEHPI